MAELVGAAAAAGTSVRAAGSGHSFTDCACTDGLMLDLSGMDRVLDADTTSGLVSVEAGITLHALGKRLAEQGLAMENQGDIDSQTLAGAISTATHGTGARYRNISSQVAAMRLVTATGEIVDLAEEADPEALAAARVGIGSLGVVASVTLRAVPIFTIERIDAPRPLADTLERLDELADTPDHFEFFVFPYSDVALTRTSTRSDRPPEPEDPRRAWVRESLIENKALDLMCRAGRRLSLRDPRDQPPRVEPGDQSVKVERSHNVYATRRDVRFTEMEYAIPREHGAEAVRRVLGLIERRRLPIGFPIEVRVVAGDDAYLSTAHARDTCYIAVHQYSGMEFETYFRAVEADHGLLRRSPPLGQAPLPVRGDPPAALPGVGALAGGARAPGPVRHVHQRLLAPGARAGGGGRVELLGPGVAGRRSALPGAGGHAAIERDHAAVARRDPRADGQQAPGRQPPALDRHAERPLA